MTLQTCVDAPESRSRRGGSLLVAAVVAAVALGAGVPGSSATATQPPGLYVTYDATCNFRITTDSGAAVGSSLPYGTYDVFINTGFPFAAGGASCDHIQFDLTGPGVSVSTDLTLGDGSAEEYAETFQANASYRAVDENHPSTGVTVFGTSNVPATAVTAPSGQTTGPPAITKTANSNSALGTTLVPGPLRGTLIGLVSPTGKLTLTDKGRPISSLRSGRYTLRVTDRSRKSGFTLQEIRRAAKTVTAAKYVGSRSITVDLAAGQWFAYPTFVGKKTYFIVRS